MVLENTTNTIPTIIPIIINGKEYLSCFNTLSYDDLIYMSKSQMESTIVYHDDSTFKCGGTLLPNDTITVTPYMIFNIAYTGNA